MFIRFVIADRDEGSGRRQGLFQAARALRASGRMSGDDLERLDELHRWFDEHLALPERFSLSPRANRKGQAISWFRDSAHGQIARMRDCQALLERYEIAVQMLREKRRDMSSTRTSTRSSPIPSRRPAAERAGRVIWFHAKARFARRAPGLPPWHPRALGREGEDEEGERPCSGGSADVAT